MYSLPISFLFILDVSLTTSFGGMNDQNILIISYWTGYDILILKLLWCNIFRRHQPSCPHYIHNTSITKRLIDSFVSTISHRYPLSLIHRQHAWNIFSTHNRSGHDKRTRAVCCFVVFVSWYLGGFVMFIYTYILWLLYLHWDKRMVIRVAVRLCGRIWVKLIGIGIKLQHSRTKHTYAHSLGHSLLKLSSIRRPQMWLHFVHRCAMSSEGSSFGGGNHIYKSTLTYCKFNPGELTSVSFKNIFFLNFAISKRHLQIFIKWVPAWKCCVRHQ